MFKKKILIISDLEGIIGIKSIFDKLSKQLMIRQLMFIIDYIKHEECNCKITICNIHGDYLLLEDDDFSTESVNLIKGVDELYCCDWDFDYVIMVGFHGKANSGGLFDHTFRNDFVRVWRSDYVGDMGEVAALILWIESKRIPVILVSGEGNFLDEIVNTNICTVHKVNHSQIITKQYESLKISIKKSLSIIHNTVYYNDISKIYIQIDNSDKLEILEKEGFKIENNCFIFINIDCFFRDLYRFALALYNAQKQIIKENYNLAILLKNLNIKKHDFPELNTIFSKSIELIDAKDRKILTQHLSL